MILRLLYALFATPWRGTVVVMSLAYFIAFAYKVDATYWAGIRIAGISWIFVWFALQTNITGATGQRSLSLAGLAFVLGILLCASLLLQIPSLYPLGNQKLGSNEYTWLAVGAGHFVVVCRILWRWCRLHGPWLNRNATHKALARNRLLNGRAANRVIYGWRETFRRTVALFYSRRVLSPYEIVIGFEPKWDRNPLKWVPRGIGLLLARLKRRPELTLFDPRPLITAKVETGALFVAGPGGGKTSSLIANLALSRCPKIFIETQGNADNKIIPALRYAGRQPYLFDLQRSQECASFNILSELATDSPYFASQIRRLANNLLSEETTSQARHMRHIAYEWLQVVLSEIVRRDEQLGREPNIGLVPGILSDETKLRNMLTAAANSKPFREVARRGLVNLADRKFAASTSVVWSQQIAFLEDPSMSCQLNGKTPLVIDPKALVGRTDWDAVIQVPRDDLVGSEGFLRMLILGLIQPRIHMSEDDANQQGDPGVIVVIDELAALNGAKILENIVEFWRQKNIRFFYCMQSVDQVEKLHGSGVFDKWVSAADACMFAKVSGAEFEKFVAPHLGDTSLVTPRKETGHGGGPNTYSQSAERVPLMEASELTRHGKFGGVALVKTHLNDVGKFQIDMPVYHEHPSLQHVCSKIPQSMTRHDTLAALITSKGKF